jgi:hypothetical protein
MSGVSLGASLLVITPTIRGVSACSAGQHSTVEQDARVMEGWCLNRSCSLILQISSLSLEIAVPCLPSYTRPHRHPVCSTSTIYKISKSL